LQVAGGTLIDPGAFGDEKVLTQGQEKANVTAGGDDVGLRRESQQNNQAVGGGVLGAGSDGAAGVGSGVAAALGFGKNLNILVPQIGQVPCAAVRPFLVVIISASLTVRSALHFMQ
jgi:hypothetical protein